jgi:hypothetical protein
VGNRWVGLDLDIVQGTEAEVAERQDSQIEHFANFPVVEEDLVDKYQEEGLAGNLDRSHQDKAPNYRKEAHLGMGVADCQRSRAAQEACQMMEALVHT